MDECVALIMPGARNTVLPEVSGETLKAEVSRSRLCCCHVRLLSQLARLTVGNGSHYEELVPLIAIMRASSESALCRLR